MSNAKGRVTPQAGQQSKGAYDVFISYRRDDGADFARCIAYWFQSKGIKCFIDVASLGAGEYGPEICLAIKNSEYFLVLVTKDAFKSEWVLKEINEAKETHEAKKIIPVSIDEKYSESPILEGIQGFELHRGKTFESNLEYLVKTGMPTCADKLAKSEDGAELLLSSIRWYKRNDGIIDEREMEKLREQADEAHVSREKLEALINVVEAEWARERKFTDAYIRPYYRKGDRNVSPEEHEELQKKAEECHISQNRLNELILKVKTESNWRLKALLLMFIALVSLAFAALAWWHGRNVGDVEAFGRGAKEREQLKSQIEKAKQAAKEAKAAAETLRLAAEKRAAVSSLARERAEKETEEVKVKLAAALESVASSNAARQDAESMLVRVKAMLETEQAERAKNKEVIEGRRKDLLEKLAMEQEARKAAEVLSAEKTAELERANEKVQVLEAEKGKLQKDLDAVRHQKQLDAFRDI